MPILRNFLFIFPNSGRGGQSANRFARLQEAARHECLKNVADVCNAVITEQNGCRGVVLAGCADMKNALLKSGMLKQVARLLGMYVVVDHLMCTSQTI